jgi:hypothetical protein
MLVSAVARRWVTLFSLVDVVGLHRSRPLSMTVSGVPETAALMRMNVA